ncbi:hypothetical protein HF263_02930 [Rhizobium leguminosarum]|uniref:hypothetical protein n=1 Tax=Rhizobium leguminosarum TaxID=384 RepID=UPI001C9230D1|nr:hypothetical protein [Rhizobium leguminosarum]MBY3055033.1 hypothetical protein [Rhizobium leguminosarum]
MVDVDDVNAYFDAQEQQSANIANFSIAAPGRTPDEAAKDFNTAHTFAKVTGNPVPPIPVVRDYRPDFESKISEFERLNALTASPRLASWLSHPENSDRAPIVADDLKPLGFWEGLGKSSLETVKSIPGGAISGTGQALEGVGRLFTPDYETPPAPVAPADAGYLERAYDWALGIRAQAIQNSDRLPTNLIKAGKSLNETGKATLPAARGWEDSWSASIGHTIGALVPLLTMGAVTGGTGAVATGIAQVAGSGAEDARNHGADEKTQNAAALWNAPFGALDLAPVMRLLKVPAVKQGVMEIAKSVAAQVALQGGTGAIQTVAANEVAKTLYDPNRATLSGVGDSAGVGGATGVITELARLGLSAIAHKSITVRQARATTADANRQVLEGVTQAAAGSVTRERSPDVFRDIVRHGVDGTPAQDIYVPADKFVEYFQSAGQNPYELARGLAGINDGDLQAAVDSGADLRIPTATYAADMAGMGHDEFFLDNARFASDEMTFAEAREFNEKKDDLRQEAWDEAESQRLADESERSTEQAIYDETVSRLRVAGRSTDVATTEAALYPSFYAARAAHEGMDPAELLAAYPLPEFHGDLPEGMQLKDVDELNRTLAAARNRKEVADTRPSLLDFIHDHGGMTDHGGELKSRDAVTVKQGKGKRTLKLGRKSEKAETGDMLGGKSEDGKKHGPDAVAQAAVEAGFLLDHPDVAEWIAATHEGREAPDITRALYDAIDDELRGTKHFSGEEPEALKQAKHLAEVEEYLGSIGLSLKDSDEHIRKGLEDAETQRYAQQARGSIQFPANGVGSGKTVIRAFEGANLSTVAHETGHYFLAVTEDMAGKGFKGASADMEALGKWWGENAADVAADGNKAMPDAALTADDVRAALERGTTGDPVKDAAIQVGKHEQFARGFEHYLMEGRAPSLDLRGAFEKFRSWMISIYRNLAGLGVKMSPDVTAVFNRMLASDAQIEEARTNSGEAGPVFATAEQMGLTQDQFDRFMKNRQQAQDDAKAKLLKEALAPIKREREEAYKAEKAAVTKEVTQEVNKLPMYRAIDWMINRRWYGDEDGGHIEVDDIRMDKETLIERYGPGVLETLPTGKRKAYTTDGGADPDDIAGLFGFDSGDEMVRAMERAPDKKQAIADQVELRMREKHGDMLTDGTAEAQALAAVHNDKKGDYLSAELRAVVEVTGRGDTLTAKQAKASARAATGRMRVRDAMDSRRYLSAERKAGDEAAKLGAQLARNKVYLDQARSKIEVTARKAAKGEATDEQVAAAIDAHNDMQETKTSTFTVKDQDRVSSKGKAFTIPGGERNVEHKGYNDLVDAYVDAKRRQLINHALYSESVKVAKEVEKAERLVKRLKSKETQSKIAGAGRRENAQIDYLAALDDVMSRYDFSSMGPGAEAKRGALNDFIAKMVEAGRENELAIPDDVLARAGQAPYKTVPVEELRGAIDVMKNIEHMALRWNKLIDAQNERSLSETVEGVVKAIDENLPKEKPGRVATSKEERKKGFRQFLNLSLNLNALSHRIDGGKHGGAFFAAIKKPIDEAVNRLTVRKVATAKKVRKAFSRYSKKEMRSMNVRKVIPELGGLSLSKLEILVIALNTGNADNLQRLTDRALLKSGGSFTLDQVQAVLNNHLDARDADFVQSVFNIHEENRQAIGERERRTTGKEPKWVDPTPTTIGGKEIPGGYYPIMYDSRLSSRSVDEDFLAQSVTGGQYSKAQTRNGHLKSRAQSSGRALSLDIGRWGNALNQADYDLELSEAVTNVGRVLNHPDVKAAFLASGNQPHLETVTDWLRDVGSGQLNGSDIVSKGSRLFKKNFTMAALGFNVASAMAQAAGLVPAFQHLGPKHFTIGVRDSMRPAMRRGVEAKSPMMAARRASGADTDISAFLKSSKRGAVGEAVHTGLDAVHRGALWLMGHAQYHLVDVPNWLGGYSKGLELYGNDEAKAIAFADDAVKRSQGSDNFHDKTALERGTTDRNKHQDSFIKLFGALSSFMATKYNAMDMTATEGRRAMADSSNSAVYLAKGAKLAATLLMLTLGDVVAGTAIKKSARWVLNGGQGEDESKDEGWTEYLAKETAFATLGNLPFFRDMSGGFQGYGDGGAYGSVLSSAVGGVRGIWNVATSEFTGREIKNSDWKSIISGIGTVSGLPAVALNRILDAELRYLQGGKVTVAEVLMGKNHR